MKATVQSICTQTGHRLCVQSRVWGAGFQKITETIFHAPELCRGRSQWSRRLRCRPAVARFLGLRVRILPRVMMSLSCDCCVLSGRGLRRTSLVERILIECGCAWVWSWSLDNEEAITATVSFKVYVLLKFYFW